MGWEKPSSSVLVYSSIGDFPAPGKPNNLYISEDTTTLYLWSDLDNSYHAVSGGASIASAVINDSSVAGANVKEALETLQSAITSGLVYKGLWDADVNIPNITSGVGISGEYYVVGVAGNTLVDGNDDWGVHDWAIFNGSVWQKIDNSDLVTSVNGKFGDVELDDVDIDNTSGVAGASVMDALNTLDVNTDWVINAW